MSAVAPEVSVVLPAWNRAGTLRAAMDSVLAQGGPPLELIVVDDGSEDATAEVAASHPDPRVRLIRLDANSGATAARNAGIAAARAPWVAFQDSDDEWLPGKLAAQMLRAAEPGTVAVYCTLRVEDPDGVSTGGSRLVPGPEVSLREGRILPALLSGSFVSTQTLMVRRDVLERLGGFDAALPALQDWELMLRVAQEGAVAHVPVPLVVQRFAPNSLTRTRGRRAEARAMILARHAGLFAQAPRLLAAQHYRVAGDLRALGDRAGAAAHLARASALAPLWPRPRLMRLWLVLRGVAGA